MSKVSREMIYAHHRAHSVQPGAAVNGWWVSPHRWKSASQRVVGSGSSTAEIRRVLRCVSSSSRCGRLPAGLELAFDSLPVSPEFELTENTTLTPSRPLSHSIALVDQRLDHSLAIPSYGGVARGSKCRRQAARVRGILVATAPAVYRDFRDHASFNGRSG